MAILAGRYVAAADLAVPDAVAGYGSSTNTVTATSWAVLPSSGASAAITNPHPSAALLVWVTWGAWMSANANAVRLCPAVSGSVTIAAGIGGGGPVAWGEIPLASVSTSQQFSSMVPYELPASGTAATFVLQAYRDSATGTQTVNYPALRIIPIRYLF